VASLRLVSPGAATDGVTLYFLKMYDLFSHRPVKSDDLFWTIVSSPSPPSRHKK